MIRKTLALISSVLLFATLLAAQGGKANADPITGTWVGEFAPDGKDSRTITMELKLDKKGAVSGTFTGMPSPGDVKKGSFDQKTAALRLELGKTGEDTVRLTLEGTVADGRATGRITGEGTGTFKLTKKN